MAGAASAALRFEVDCGRPSTGIPASFDDVAEVALPLSQGLAMEGEMVEAAGNGTSCARIWESVPMLVVPRNYRNYPRFELVQREWAQGPMPVCVRSSGGGVVPQGPGVLNVSLAWRTGQAALEGAEEIYRGLCQLIAEPLARAGIPCEASAVPESYCDGRYNLSVAGRKIAGTAQHWHRAGGQYVVLAHVMVVVDADPRELTAAANRFEQDLQSGKSYSPDALTSVAREMSARDGRMPHDDVPRNRLVASLLADLQGGRRGGLACVEW